MNLSNSTREYYDIAPSRRRVPVIVLKYYQRMMLWAALDPSRLLAAAHSFVCCCLGIGYARTALNPDLPARLSLLISDSHDAAAVAVRYVERMGLAAKLRFVSGQTELGDLARRLAHARACGEQLVLLDCPARAAPIVLFLAADATPAPIHPTFRIFLVSPSSQALPVQLLEHGVRVVLQPFPFVQDRVLAAYEVALTTRFAPRDHHTVGDKTDEILSRSSLKTLTSSGQGGGLPLLLRRLNEAVGWTISKPTNMLPELIVARQESFERYLEDCWRAFVVAAVHAVVGGTEHPPRYRDLEAVCQVAFADDMAVNGDCSAFLPIVMELMHGAGLATEAARALHRRSCVSANAWSHPHFENMDSLVDYILERREFLPTWAAGLYHSDE